jgi:hypothetical protein
MTVLKRGNVETFAPKGSKLVKFEPKSAVFCITDENVDRSRDIVRLDLNSFENWRKAGAPWFTHHNSQGSFPIGTSIIPGTDDRLDVWKEGSKWMGRVYFDLDDEVGKFVSQKVGKGLLRACSIAFVPEEMEPSGFGGKTFHGADITEISLCGVGDNPNALLQMVEDKSCPAELRKSLRYHLASFNLGQELAALRHDILEYEASEIRKDYKAMVQADIEGPINDPTDRYNDEEMGLSSDGAGPVEIGGEAQLVDAGDVPDFDTKCPSCLGTGKCSYCEKGVQYSKNSFGIRRFPCYRCKGHAKCIECGGSGVTARQEIIDRYSDSDGDNVAVDAETDGDDEAEYQAMRESYDLPPSQLS